MQKARPFPVGLKRTSEGYPFLHPSRYGVYGSQVAKLVAEFLDFCGG
jgi:hypothetical protein